MPINMEQILSEVTTELNTNAEAQATEVVKDRVAKIQAALTERQNEVAKYEAKLAAFKAEVVAATSPAQVMSICGKNKYTVKFLHLND